MKTLWRWSEQFSPSQTWPPQTCDWRDICKLCPLQLQPEKERNKNQLNKRSVRSAAIWIQTLDLTEIILQKQWNSGPCPVHIKTCEEYQVFSSMCYLYHYYQFFLIVFNNYIKSYWSIRNCVLIFTCCKVLNILNNFCFIYCTCFIFVFSYYYAPFSTSNSFATFNVRIFFPIIFINTLFAYFTYCSAE